MVARSKSCGLSRQTRRPAVSRVNPRPTPLGRYFEGPLPVNRHAGGRQIIHLFALRRAVVVTIPLQLFQ
jgi:hypothetical protein